MLKAKSSIPGFGLTMGYTMFYLSVIVLIPLSALFLKSFSLGWDEFIMQQQVQKYSSKVIN